MNTRLLINGKESFDYIFDKIEKARESILVHMFIWRYDDTGVTLARKILEAANRGVKVVIVKDAFGAVFELGEESRRSFFHNEWEAEIRFRSYVIDWGYSEKGKGKRCYKKSDLLKEMEKHPNIIIKRRKKLKDHSKYYIIDQQHLILGGINVEDKEVTVDVAGRTYYDFMLGIEDKNTVNYFIRRLKQQESFKPDRIIEFMFNNYQIVDDRRELQTPVKKQLLELIALARESIYIVMAYIGDEDIHQAIVDQVKAGVKVVLIMPKTANVQHDFNMYHLKNIMRQSDNKIELYLSHKMIHGKLMVIDEKLVTFGSINFNRFAMEMLGELNVIYHMDEETKEKLMTSIYEEMSKADRIENGEVIPYHSFRLWLEQNLAK